MNHSSAILFESIRIERALAELPARQERRRVARLAAEIARCCRVSLVDRLIARLEGTATAAVGAPR